jgi:thioredoxin-related protein
VCLFTRSARAGARSTDDEGISSMNVVRHLSRVAAGIFAGIVVGFGSFANAATPSAPSARPAAAPAAKPPSASLATAKLDWVESFVQASRQARQQDKVIMAYFCGSDWCAWCQKLDKEVLTTPMFVEWAKANVVPLKLDYPSPDKRQSRATAKQNEILAATYNVAKIPTLLFMDSDGEVIDRAGYDSACLRDDEKPGSPLKAIARFEEILKSRPQGQQVKEYAFLDAAEFTSKNGMPVLVMITKPDNKLGVETRDRLLKSSKFGKFANANVAFVNLTWPGVDDISDQAKWFKTFTEAHKLGPAPIQLVLMSYGARKVMTKVMVVDQIDGLINHLAKEMPKYDYNGGWLTDYRKAQSIVAQTGRDMLLSFTSFDSSEFCQKLDKEIYQTDAVTEYAKANLVLVKVDFPTMTELSKELKTQNTSLAEQFNIRGYPSIVLINAKGQKFGTAKYQTGGPDPFVKEIDQLRRKDYERRTVMSDTVEVKKKPKPTE